MKRALAAGPVFALSPFVLHAYGLPGPLIAGVGGLVALLILAEWIPVALQRSRRAWRRFRRDEDLEPPDQAS
jgi:hypothetical protein